MCKICSIENQKLFNRIENLLLQNDGTLMAVDKRSLRESFPAEINLIESLSDHDLENHYKEHQSSIRLERPESKESLTSDINKDEAEILYGVLNKQAQTFTKITEKINRAIEGAESEDFYTTVHSGTLELYKEVSNSIRGNIRLLNEMNSAINGSKNSAMEGLMALAKALRPNDENKEDLSTNEYD